MNRVQRETIKILSSPAARSSLLAPLFPHLRSSAFICGSLFFLSGCGSAVNSGHNTALDGVDLVKMTDDMAQQIVADADVQSAIREHGALTVVVQPVVNRMQGEVLPRGPAEAFTARVRVRLARSAPGQFTWVMNRDAFYRLQARERDIDPGPSPERAQPQYALTATFSSITAQDAVHRTSYYLCTYELTAISSGATLWTGAYEVKKAAVKGFLD